jgi:hypothetical protein
MIQTHRKNREKEQLILSILICILLFIPQINYYVNVILQTGLTIESVYLTPVVYICLILLAIYSYFFCTRNSSKALSVIMIAIFVFVISFLLFPNNRQFMFTTIFDGVNNPTYRLFFYAFPLLVLALTLNEYSTLYKKIVEFSIVNTVIAVFAYIFVVMNKGQHFEYMTFSYNMLFGVCICLYYGIRNKHIPCLGLGIIGSFVILFGGARGAVLSLMIFICFYIVFLRQNKNYLKQMLFFSFLLIGIFYTYFYFDLIVQSMISVGNDFGISSRALTRLAEESFIESVGRSEISNAIWAGIEESPIIGYGIWGDRAVTLNYGYGKGSYAHNIVLEIICQFGIVIGSFLIIFLLYLLFRRIRRNDKSLYYVILFATIPSGLIKLLFSGSYLTEPYFFFLLGMLLHEHKIKNNRDDERIILDEKNIDNSKYDSFI